LLQENRTTEVELTRIKYDRDETRAKRENYQKAHIPRTKATGTCSEKQLTGKREGKQKERNPDINQKGERVDDQNSAS